MDDLTASEPVPSEPVLQAPSRLEPLLAGELRALALIKERKQIDLATNVAATDDPERAASWGEDRQIRGIFLSWLIVEGELENWLPAIALSCVG